MPDKIIIYVFGSCHFSERFDSDEAVGNGGFGVVITKNGISVDQFSGGFSNTTNARMEIIGITEGLKRIKEPSIVTVYSKYGYVIDTLAKGWLAIWKRENYKKKKHVDLWKALDTLLQETPHTISFKHAKEIKNKIYFQEAEGLGKAISGKKSLPMDLKKEVISSTLFNSEPLSTNQTFDANNFEDDKPRMDGVCVDSSCIGNPGKMEYRGVDLKTGKLLFEMKYEEATNNIGEFLAIVHALALYKRDGKELKIVYSDSQYAISWVKQKDCKTNLAKTEKNAIVFEHIQRAVNWLKSNDYETKVLKWNTAAWGEIPADYGRK